MLLWQVSKDLRRGAHALGTGNRESRCVQNGGGPFAVLLLVLLTVTCNMARLQMDGNMLRRNTFTAGGETPPNTTAQPESRLVCFPVHAALGIQRDR